MNTDPIVVEQQVGQSIDVVWRALTNLDEMKQWFFEEIDKFEPEVGFKTHFVVNPGDRDYVHLWEIVEVEPNSRIVYDWRYKGVEGGATVAFECSEVAGGTLITLTQHGAHTFPQDNPMFTREAGIAGWEFFIRNSLPAYLARGSNQ